MKSAVAILSLAIAVLAGNIAQAGEALLADAAQKNDQKAVRELIDGDVDVNAAQADGMTALHWAAYHDAPQLVEQLIAAGADVSRTNRYGVTPLSLACTNGNGAIVDLLLEHGADPNIALPGGETALMTAARTGIVAPVKSLIARGAEVNAREHKGQTALMWAAAEGNTDVVDVLLAAGADFRASLPSGFTPFFFAVREGKTETAKRLLNAGIDVNDVLKPQRLSSNGPKSTTALILAIENGHFELAVALLDAGADPNLAPAGYSALHAMTWVRKPIRGDGDPPPIGSGKVNSLQAVRQIVAHGGQVNARLQKGESGRGRFTTTGSTPFLLAARSSDVALMRQLLELGADPNLANVDDCPPLLAAAGVGALGDGDESAGTEEEALAAVQYLLELGVDVDAVDKHGETAMHGAAYQNRADVVTCLARQHADVNVWHQKNKLGWTPLMIAQGHRPGNFRPAPETIAAIERALLAEGIEPPKASSEINRPDY